MIAPKFSKNALISKLFSFLIYDFSLRSYGLFRVIGPKYGGEPPPVFAFLIFFTFVFYSTPLLSVVKAEVKVGKVIGR